VNIRKSDHEPSISTAVPESVGPTNHSNNVMHRYEIYISHKVMRAYLIIITK